MADQKISQLAEHTSPVDADVLPIVNSGTTKKVTWANIKAVLKTYFDGLYALAAKGVTNGDSHDHNDGDGAQIAYSTLSGTPTIPVKASAAEINTGTNDAKFATPDALAGSIHGLKQIQIKIFDDATALATGDGKLIFMIPEALNGMNLVKAHAAVTTVSSSGAPTIQIRNVTDAVDMLSTLITIDASEYTSYSAATPPVIDATKDDVATGDLIAIDVDGAGTGAKGLIIYLAFQTP